MVLEALNILRGLDLRGMGHNSAAYIHAVTEALKLAAADREVYFGDPDFVDVPLDVLLSRRLRRAAARPDRSGEGVARHAAGRRGGRRVDPAVAPRSFRRAPPGIADTRPETSFLCVADSHGNVFAATPSDPAISGPVVPGTGVTVSMWGSRGYTSPDHPARIGPGRRPRMSANPAIAIKRGEMVMPFGSPGSEVLGQAMVQVFLNQTVFGMDPQSACEAPRFASYSWPESALPHSYQAGSPLRRQEDVGSGSRANHWPYLGHRSSTGPSANMPGRLCLHNPVRPAHRREIGRRRPATHGLRGRLVMRFLTDIAPPRHGRPPHRHGRPCAGHQ